jgi:hypothetical protein
MSCQPVIPETQQAYAVPDAATVYSFLSGRVADAPFEKGGKNYPCARSMSVEPEHNPYLYYSKAVTTQKPPWFRRVIREAQNPYGLTGSGVNATYPAQADVGKSIPCYFPHQQVASPRRTGAFTLGGHPFAHAERHISRSRENPVYDSHPHHHGSHPGFDGKARARARSASAAESLIRREQMRTRRAATETRTYATGSVPMNPAKTDGFWRPRSCRREHRERTWNWQR